MPEDIAYAVVGTLTKSHTEDGVLTFEASKATGPDLDADGQRVSMEWAVPAMREWFATGGNLREQHDPKRAIGKALTLEEREDGAYIGGRVIDPVAIAKVNEGVLQHLSIGVKGHKVDYTQKTVAPNGMIVGGKIVEVSLVDRPSNPTTRLVLAKAAAPDGHLEVPETIEEVIEPDAEKAERVEHAHTHQRAGSHHRHTHVHRPGVAEHRSLEGDIPHHHAHTADDPDVEADRAQHLSDGDTSSPSKVIDPDMVKAVLAAADRAALPASDFAIPSKRPGSGSYPINDEAHARDALARSQGKPEEGTVRAAVKRKYPDMDVEDSDKAEDIDQEQIEGDLALLVKAAKPTKSNPDPDKDGDDDTTPSGDSDHDFWNEDGTPTAKGKAAGLKAKSEEPDAPKSDTPDLIKTLMADPDKVAELRKALGIDEAESDLREKVKSLEADLEKALDAPMLTPPSRTRPAGAAAVTAAKTALEAKRDYFGHLAATIEDSELRKGYAEMAKAAEADLQKIA